MREMIPIIVPNETVSDETVRVMTWFVSNGEHVGEDHLLVEVETSKALLEIHSTSAGYVWHCSNPGDDVAVGSPICFITNSSEAPVLNVTESDHAFAPEPDGDLPPARLTAQAAQAAKALGLDTSAFQRGSLVRSQDVFAKSSQTAPVTQLAQCASTAVAGVPLRWETLPKRKTAEARLLASGQAASVPSFVTSAYPIAELRTKFAARKPAPSVSALIIFEVARLLRKYPVFNSVHSEGRAGFYEEVNIGWALDDGEGLVVPVIINADHKTVSEIEAETERYTAAYVHNRLSAKDLVGATFAISDLSGEGVSMFMPLISRGQSSILGIGADTLTLAFDHQLAEGHSAARFLKDLGARLDVYSHASNGSANEPAELSCAFCGSGATELRANKTFLLRCEVPAQGYVCSLCLANY